MVEIRGVVYELLGTNSRDTAVPPAGFYDQLMRIDEELQRIERQLASLSLFYAGLRAQERLSKLEQDYTSLVADIESAHTAVVTGEPYRFERTDYNWSENYAENEFFEFTKEYTEKIEDLRKTSARVGQLINSKRNSANTRLVAAVSAIALGVSLISLFLSLIPILF